MSTESISITPNMAIASGRCKRSGLRYVMYACTGSAFGSVEPSSAGSSYPPKAYMNIMSAAFDTAGRLMGSVTEKKLLKGDAPRFSAASPNVLETDAISASV